MIKNRRHFKVAVASLIFVLTIVYIQWKKIDGIRIPSESIKRLPYFEAIDILGRPVNSRDARGRVLYVQFLSGLSVLDIRLLKEIYLSWEKEGLLVMAIVDLQNDDLYRLSIDFPQMVIINRYYEKLLNKFKAPVSDMYYLFDTSGATVVAGQTIWQSEAGLKSPLNRLLKNKVFDISTIIPIETYIHEHEWLGQIAKIIEEDLYDYYVIAMFANICAGCSSGMILESLRDIYSKRKTSVSVTCILNGSFTNQDAINLGAQLGLPFRTVVADESLGARWKWAINEYSERDVTDMVMIIDKKGKIIKLSYPNCAMCLAELIESLQELLKMS